MKIQVGLETLTQKLLTGVWALMCFQVRALGVHLPAAVEVTAMSSPSSFGWPLTFDLIPSRLFWIFFNLHEREWGRGGRCQGSACDYMLLLRYAVIQWVCEHISRCNDLLTATEWQMGSHSDLVLLGDDRFWRGWVRFSPTAAQKLIPKIVRLAYWSQISSRDVGLILQIALKLQTSL